MDSPRANTHASGEFEIEKVSVHEVEIKRKELLPVFDHFQCIKPSWNNRGLAEEKRPLSPSSGPYQAEDKIAQQTVICHSNPASLSSTESSEGGSSRRIENLLDLDQVNNDKLYVPTGQTLNEIYNGRHEVTMVESSTLNKRCLDIVSASPEHSENDNPHVNNHIPNGLPSLESNLPSAGRDDTIVAVSMLGADYYDSHMGIIMEDRALPLLSCPVNLGVSLREEHCKIVEQNGLCKSTDVVNDDINGGNSHCESKKLEEDVEDDEMLGGMFAFFEEG